MVVAAALVPADLALAARASEVAVDSIFSIDKTASGTKISGPLTITYEVLGEGIDGCEISTRMQAFLRLRKGAGYNGYGMAAAQVCYEAVSDQQDLLVDFIRDVVILKAFPETPAAPFALKSVDLIVDGGDGVTEPLFTIMDVVIAVQD